MKACIIQPPYSMDFSDVETLFPWYLDALDRCDESIDIIVLPEYSNRPCRVYTKEQFLTSISLTTEKLLQKVSQTAKRCNAIVFVNMAYSTPTGLRNTTVVFDRCGEEVGYYYKQHLTAGEEHIFQVDSDYTYDFSEPTVITVDGVRYGFITCYDTYFYEAFANIARQNVDVIVSCSYMRSDPHHVLELLNSFCCYNCNAYMLRSSVSLGADSPVGGCSMVVAPDGKILLNMQNNVGLGCVEFDPKQKYYKPAGFGNPPAAHYSYVEIGRRPWKYRPAGSAIVCNDKTMKYPRTCAWGGYQPKLPACSMVAFGAAIAQDVQEIGLPLCLHDSILMAGQTPMEKILRKFSCHAILHINVDHLEMTEAVLEMLCKLLHRYDCKNYAYLVSRDPAMLAWLRQIEPSLRLCLAAEQGEEALSKAVEIGCEKIQLPNVSAQLLEKIHEAGLTCNVLSGEVGDTFVCHDFSTHFESL